MSQAQYFAHQKLVFDGRKNLYSRRPLPIGRDRVSCILYMYMCRSSIRKIVQGGQKLTVKKFWELSPSYSHTLHYLHRDILYW